MATTQARTARSGASGSVVVALGALFGLTAVGSSAVAVVLGDLRAALALETGEVAWVFSAFGLAFAATTALFGRLGDAVGQRTPLLVGVVAMGVGAALTAAAPGLGLLVLGRLVQGAGAGAVPALVPAVVAVRVPAADRAVVLGRIAAVTGAMAATGPLAGGLVAAALGWRAAVALPALALLALPVAARLATSRGTSQPVDLRGAGLVAAAGAALVLLLQAPSAGLPVALLGAALAAVSWPLVPRHLHRRPDGFLPAEVVRSVTVVGSGLAGASLAAVYLAILFAVPTNLATTQGWSAVVIGLALLPAATAGPIATTLARRLVGRVDPRMLAAAGAASSGLGAALAAALPGTAAAQVAGLAGGIAGYGLAQPALLDRIATAVAAPIRGTAIGFFNLVFFLGGAAGSAVVGGLGTGPGLVACAGAAGLAAAAQASASLRVRHRGTGATGRPVAAATVAGCLSCDER